jgi:DNA ligase 1
MLLREVADSSERVASTSGRNAKIEILSDVLRRATPPEVSVVVSYLSGELPGGRIGIGYAALGEMRGVVAAETPSLELLGLDAELRDIGSTAGAGSAKRRLEKLGSIFSRATGVEQKFLFGLLSGELRQGAQEGVMLDAVAKAARVEAALVRRAAMLGGSIPRVAEVALARGADGLGEFRLELMRPIQPMLAQVAADPEEALERHSELALEYKLDGARIQVHKSGDEVRVFSRLLNEVTPAVPEVVELVRELPAEQLVLDGEAIVLKPDGSPEPFQVTMRRFGRKLDVENLRPKLPLSPFFFDVIHADGRDLIDSAGAERFDVLERIVPESRRIPRTLASDEASVDAFYQRALASGHEGIMMKAAQAPYEAGRRGASWFKLKPAHTLDLVVLAVEPGSGRRSGFLSNIHLGARDPDKGGFVMLGKTFKGMTDEILKWQTEKFTSLELAREDYVVHLKPELVAEIAFDGLQESPHYPGGLALRFARLKRYRTDKPAAEADTIETVRKIYAEGHRGGR